MPTETKKKSTGVFQLKNGNWGYRVVTEVNGFRKDHRRNVDPEGNPFKTQAAAARARAKALQEFNENHTPIPKGPSKRKNSIEAPENQLNQITFDYVFAKFCENGRNDRAPATKRKQDSLWKNHIGPKFGERLIKSVSVAEINDYLVFLYYVEARAYLYVEGFLKMFYLIYGQAYSRGYISIDLYNKMCVNQSTKIRMPKMKVDEDMDIVAFSQEELHLLDAYFVGTNAETAYMLGRYCGLRINEAYGLKWGNVNFEENYILIDRQMRYENGIISLVQPKTRNAIRKVVMCDKLKEYLLGVYQNLQIAKHMMEQQRRQNQTYIIDVDGKRISSLELVNCLPNGNIQTINSMKYHAKNIKSQLGINFRFHYLRHTFGTMLASMNTPIILLCAQMGHSKIETTKKYYISKSKLNTSELLQNLNQI